MTQTVATFMFNATSLQYGKQFPQPEDIDFPKIEFKYASLQHAYKNTTDYVRQVIDSCPLKNQHKSIVVDIKVTQIKKGKPPCLPGWHCDTIINPFDTTQPENHHLFVSGHASLTEFIGSPIELEIASDLQHQVLLASLRKQLDTHLYRIVKIPSCQIISYGRFDFHRGSLGLGEEKRLLVRVTETDVILPCNQPFHSKI